MLFPVTHGEGVLLLARSGCPGGEAYLRIILVRGIPRLAVPAPAGIGRGSVAWVRLPVVRGRVAAKTRPKHVREPLAVGGIGEQSPSSVFGSLFVAWENVLRGMWR